MDATFAVERPPPRAIPGDVIDAGSGDDRHVRVVEGESPDSGADQQAQGATPPLIR
jgi:hypothetical protein